MFISLSLSFLPFYHFTPPFSSSFCFLLSFLTLSPFFYHAVKLRFRVAGGSIKPRVRYYLVFIVLVKSICARRCTFVYVSPRKSAIYRTTSRERGGGRHVTSEIASKSRSYVVFILTFGGILAFLFFFSFEVVTRRIIEQIFFPNEIKIPSGRATSLPVPPNFVQR